MIVIHRHYSTNNDIKLISLSPNTQLDVLCRIRFAKWEMFWCLISESFCELRGLPWILVREGALALVNLLGFNRSLDDLRTKTITWPIYDLSKVTRSLIWFNQRICGKAESNMSDGYTKIWLNILINQNCTVGSLYPRYIDDLILLHNVEITWALLESCCPRKLVHFRISMINDHIITGFAECWW